MKRGFTLLELLVASALLAMLVTILTMIFNQSSIAWTVGTASITGLGEVRRDMAIAADEAENYVGNEGGTPMRIVSVWNENGNGLRPEGRTLSSQFTKLSSADLKTGDPIQDKPIAIGGATAVGRATWIVGVTSYGPDGQTGGDNTWDDITTMPEEIVQ